MARKPLRLWLAYVVALSVVFGSAEAFAQTPRIRDLIRDLRSPERKTRHDAADELGEPPHPNIHAVMPLLIAAKRESHHGALAAMLRPLGKSGMLEVLGFIQTHAQSPIAGLRNAGRRALKDWLVTNGVLDPDDELPEPPHPFYREPPRFSPMRAAGRPIAVWAGREPPTSPDGVPARPMYEGARPDGIPQGYVLGHEPKWRLVIAGLATFGGLYIGSNIVAAALAAEDDAYPPELLIPIAGPIFPAAELFDEDGFLSGIAHFFGALLVVDALGQLTGAVLAIAGAASKQPALRRQPPTGPSVSFSITPNGVALFGSF